MKTSDLKEVRKMYESSADAYSEMMDKEIDLPVYRKMLGRVHQDIADIPGVLLDIACGSGHMLSMFRSLYDPERPLMGIDISPRMVDIARQRLGKDARVSVGDMQSLQGMDTDSVAGIINFFAIHHLDPDELKAAMHEWYRVLTGNGRLLLAAWEGRGIIDYGDESDIVALRYTCEELSEIALKAGFLVTRCTVEPVEDFPMDALYMECLKE